MYKGRIYLGVEIGALLHEGAKSEPEGIPEGEIVVELEIVRHEQTVVFVDMLMTVFVFVAVVVLLFVHLCAGAGDWEDPLAGREASHDPDCEGHEDVGDEHPEPDLCGEGVQEREHPIRHPLRGLHHNQTQIGR